MLFDNSNKLPILILEKELNEEASIIDKNLYNKISKLQDDKR